MIVRGWGAAEFEETSSKTQEREETTIVRADDPTRWGPSVIFIAFDGDVQGIAPILPGACKRRDLAPQDAFVPRNEVRNTQHRRWKGEGDLSALVNANQLGFERVV
jgi:hypothetical protein